MSSAVFLLSSKSMSLLKTHTVRSSHLNNQNLLGYYLSDDVYNTRNINTAAAVYNKFLAAPRQAILA